MMLRGGPLLAIRNFFAQNNNLSRAFAVNRARELMYSHHVGGYLKRVDA